jgi:hypothetical protein
VEEMGLQLLPVSNGAATASYLKWGCYYFLFEKNNALNK